MEKNKNAAFTLVELLVVISIIALLLAVLMPALQKARQQAKTTLCKSNLKQMGLTLLLYAEDSRGKFPSRNSSSPMSPNTYYVQDRPVASDHRWFWKGYVDGYKLKNLGERNDGYDFAPKVMYCPSTVGTSWGFGKCWPQVTSYNFNAYMTSYDYFNLGALKDTSKTDWCSKTKCPERNTDPGYVPVFGDALVYRPVMGAAYFRIANHFKSGAKEYVYEKQEKPLGVNNVRVDGSVEWYNYKKVEVYWNDRQFTTKNYWGKPR